MLPGRDVPEPCGNTLHERRRGHGSHRAGRHATPAELAIDEHTTGVYCFEAPLVFQMLRRVRNENGQGEYYLPDVLVELLRDGRAVRAVVLKDNDETLGVNSPEDLARVEKVLAGRK